MKEAAVTVEVLDVTEVNRMKENEEEVFDDIEK